MKFAAFCATALLLLLAAGNAAASITYVANRAVGAGVLDLSITTDGTLGVLTSANILDWSLGLDDGFTAITLEGPGGLNNSAARISNTGLSATAFDLVYDFDVVSQIVTPAAFVIQIFNPGGELEPFWCVAYSGCADTQTESFSTDAMAFQVSQRTGQFVVGSVSSAAPEPAAWALAITGFATAGVALRRRGRTAQV